MAQYAPPTPLTSVPPRRGRYAPEGTYDRVLFPADRQAAAELGVRQLIDLVDPDPARQAVTDTPARVVKAFLELTAGYDTDIADVLARQFDVGDADEMVVVVGVDFVSLCEHHLLPFTGTATVGYLPAEGGPVVGLSKLARLVDAYARRLQVQERMTSQITGALTEHLQGIRGAGAVVRSSHACMGIRGVRKPNAQMVTSSLTGMFRDDARTRAEFMALANG